jgi:hypothetical protein
VIAERGSLHDQLEGLQLPEILGLQLWQCEKCQTVRWWGRGAPEDQDLVPRLTCEVCGKGSERRVISRPTGEMIEYVTLHAPHRFIGLR